MEDVENGAERLQKASEFRGRRFAGDVSRETIPTMTKIMGINALERAVSAKTHDLRR